VAFVLPLAFQRAARGDRVKEEDNSITGGTIKLGVDDASDEARVMLLGDVKEGEAGEETYHETGESAPYVGTGYIRVRRKDNKTRLCRLLGA